MFQNKPATFVQQLFFKNQLWQVVNRSQCIGGTGKYEVELFVAAFHKTKYIRLYRFEIFQLQISRSLPDKRKHLVVLFNDGEVLHAS